MIAKAWAAPSLPGRKAAAYFDEDSLTMAQAAVSKLQSATSDADALYFASTSSPYWQRSAASLIAAYCNLRPETMTANLGGSLRAGTTALRTAFDALRAGSRKHAIVVASESREARPGSAEEMILGDAAAAIAIGSQHVIADIITIASRSDDFLDEWRRDSDRWVKSFPSKFSTTHGYEANTITVIHALLKEANMAAEDVTHFALASPDGRAHLNVAKELGVPADRVGDTRLSDVGVTGATTPFLVLAQALDTAIPGDLIICTGYGEGADGLILRITEEINQLHRPIIKNSRTFEYPSYQIYRKLRDCLRQEDSGPEISNVLWELEKSQNVHLHGTFCPKCERLQFPTTRVCGTCRNTEDLTERALSRRGEVFTFNKDYLYDAPVQPTVNAVVDLENGGRFLCQMTDVDEREVLAKVAVKNHRNGALNPRAHLQINITEDQVLSASMVSYPLGLYDCCPITDGAAAAVICRASIAREFRKDFVLIKGIGLAVTSGLPWFDSRHEYVGFESTCTAADEAYRMAGVKDPVREIDFAEVHDCFTWTEISNYEDLGFCKKGAGMAFISEGRSAITGDLPVNPSGGLKSFGHPVGASGVRMIYEVVTRLRGESAPRQVQNARLGLVHNLGGPGAVACVVILGQH
jgi:hydroxymethylglutaryl-CoA synthase